MSKKKDKFTVKFKCDPKSIDIPNINFSIYTEGDKREKQFLEQRMERGFDESETWSLRDTIARFIIPRLEAYEEIANNTIIRDKKLKKDVKYFLKAMKLISRDEGSCMWNKKEEKIVDKGLKAFPKIFMTLWW